MRLVEYLHEDKERLGRLEEGRSIGLQLAAFEAGSGTVLVGTDAA